MIIKSLDLENYRNYSSLHMDFSDGVNILYGDNAQGKTNILESIYMSATTKSHRGSKDKEVIKFGFEECHIKTLLDKEGLGRRVDMHLRSGKSKGIAVDQVRLKRATELLGLLKVVLFSPEDLSIIKNAPSERRRFINSELCQLDSIYTYNLESYNRIVDQRNKLLKEIFENHDYKETIFVWDMQLVSFGKKIIERRREFVEQLNVIIKDIHKSLSGGKEELVIKYDPNVNEKEFEKTLSKNLERDIHLKSTSAGPHKDDISFFINGMDVRTYGSQGQQRTVALSLKLAEIELVKIVAGDNPVLLLDDVLSELDVNRQNHLLDRIGDIQTIITCTGLDDFVNARFEYDKVFKVVEGNVTMEN